MTTPVDTQCGYGKFHKAPPLEEDLQSINGCRESSQCSPEATPWLASQAPWSALNMYIQTTLNGLRRLYMCVCKNISMHIYYINVVLMCEIIKNKEQLKLGEAVGNPLETQH